MPNRPRVSQESVEKIENAMFAFEEAHSDGEITADEIFQIGQLMWEAHQAAMYADSNVKLHVPMSIDDLGRYTRELANLVGLRDWTVNLSTRSGDERDTSGEDRTGCATQFVPWGTQRVDIDLAPGWETWSADDLRVTLVHELIHCHMIRMMWTWNGALADLVTYEPLHHALNRAFQTDHEVATEAIATAWAELLPLPGEQEPRPPVHREGGAMDG